MSLQWSEQYTTGMTGIDEQHRRLFGMVNDLESRLKRNEPPAQMVEILKGMADYVATHFADEEGAMDRCGCPNACVNKMAHQRFSRLVKSRLQAVTLSPPTREVFQNLHTEVEEWLKDHICRIDIKLREYACAKVG